MNIVEGNFFEMPWMEVLESDGVTHRCRKVMFQGERALVQIGEFCNGHKLKPHTHEYEQIAIIWQGVCDFFIDGVPHHMTAGSWIVIPSGAEHYIQVKDSPVPVMNMDIFIPRREENYKAYEKFLASLKEVK